jgi:hypothetical protein
MATLLEVMQYLPLILPNTSAGVQAMGLQKWSFKALSFIIFKASSSALASIGRLALSSLNNAASKVSLLRILIMVCVSTFAMLPKAFSAQGFIPSGRVSFPMLLLTIKKRLISSFSSSFKPAIVSGKSIIEGITLTLVLYYKKFVLEKVMSNNLKK